MREQDISRVKRAIGHIMAAFINIDCIELENRTLFEQSILKKSIDSLAGGYSALIVLVKVADPMARMAEDLKERSLTVESIIGKYVSTATPELRQHLIDRLNQMRQSGQVPEKTAEEE